MSYQDTLHMTPFHYAQAFAVEKLAQTIEKHGGELLPFNEPITIKVRNCSSFGKNTDEYEQAYLEENFPDFQTRFSSWSGWQINFNYKGNHYEVCGDGNPFFPVHVWKKPIGEKRRALGEEFDKFGFVYGTPSDPCNFGKPNMEIDEYAERAFDALVAMPLCKLEREEKISYTRRTYR